MLENIEITLQQCVTTVPVSELIVGNIVTAVQCTSCRINHVFVL